MLDVNVLIALIDPGHVAHRAAHRWIRAVSRASWATCPITENGILRIVGHVRSPNSPGSPAAVSLILRKLRALPGHRFWSDDLSLVAAESVDPGRLLTSAQITDSYLLALAKRHGGKLATLDRRLSAAAVSDGEAALCLINAP